MSSLFLANPLDDPLCARLTRSVAKRNSTVAISGEAFALWRRDEMRLGQQKLADAAGLSLGAIQRIEKNGVQRVHLSTVADLADATGLTVEKLLERVAPPLAGVDAAYEEIARELGPALAERLARLALINIHPSFRQGLRNILAHSGGEETLLPLALKQHLLRFGASAVGPPGLREAATSDLPPRSLDELEVKRRKKGV